MAYNEELHAAIADFCDCPVAGQQMTVSLLQRSYSSILTQKHFMAGKNKKWEEAYDKFKSDLKDLEKQRGKLDRELKEYHDLLSKVSRHVQILELWTTDEDPVIPPIADKEHETTRDEQHRLPATTQMQQIQLSFNLQFLLWQKAMKSEIEAFDAVRQTMKKKHG